MIRPDAIAPSPRDKRRLLVLHHEEMLCGACRTLYKAVFVLHVCIVAVSTSSFFFRRSSLPYTNYWYVVILLSRVHGMLSFGLRISASSSALDLEAGCRAPSVLQDVPFLVQRVFMGQLLLELAAKSNTY